MRGFGDRAVILKVGVSAGSERLVPWSTGRVQWAAVGQSWPAARKGGQKRQYSGHTADREIGGSGLFTILKTTEGLLCGHGARRSDYRGVIGNRPGTGMMECTAADRGSSKTRSSKRQNLKSEKAKLEVGTRKTNRDEHNGMRHFFFLHFFFILRRDMRSSQDTPAAELPAYADPFPFCFQRGLLPLSGMEGVALLPRGLRY